VRCFIPLLEFLSFIVYLQVNFLPYNILYLETINTHYYKYMKVIVILFFILLPAQALSFAIGIGAGGITPHFVSGKRDYCNQWNDTGIITNKSRYITLASGRWMMTIAEGEDSICSKIQGLMFTWGFKFEERLDVGIVFGGYNYIQKNWTAHELKAPDGVDSPTPFTIRIGKERFVPIGGIQVGLHLIRSADGWSLILNNILTPIVFNHSLMVQYRF
jgi:hypothetical protein